MNIEEIKKYMKQNKITYAQLSDMTGLSISTITKIFGGFAKYPRVDTMQAIENALGLSSPSKQTVQIPAKDEILLKYFHQLSEELKDIAIDTVRTLAGVPVAGSLQKKA